MANNIGAHVSIKSIFLMGITISIKKAIRVSLDDPIHFHFDLLGKSIFIKK